MSRRRAPAFALVVAAAAGMLHACGSFDTRDPPPAAPDGGPDGGPEASPTPDAAPHGCLTAPAETLGEGKFCGLEERYFERCGQCEECRQRNLNDCVTLGAALSDGFKATFDACVDELKCTEFKEFLNDPCVLEQLPNAPRTAAQLAVRDAFCNACGDAGAPCRGFYAALPDGGGSAGIYVAIMNDDLAKAVEQHCIGGTNCDPFWFELCSSSQLCSVLNGKDSCDKSFCP